MCHLRDLRYLSLKFISAGIEVASVIGICVVINNHVPLVWWEACLLGFGMINFMPRLIG